MTEAVVGEFQQVEIHRDDAELFQPALCGIPFQRIAVAQMGEVVGIGNLVQQLCFPFPVHFFHKLSDAVQDRER